MGFIKNICNWSVLKILVFLVAITSSLMIFGYFLYFALYLRRPLGDVQDWGSFGNYMGSITGLLAFAGVLYSLVLSEKRTADAKKKTLDAEYDAILAKQEAKQEVAAAKRESDKREAKATEAAIKREERDLFFKLLDLHREQLNSIGYTDKLNSYNNANNGIDTFEIYGEIINSFLVDYSYRKCISKIKIEDLENLKERFPNKYSFVNDRTLEICLEIYKQYSAPDQTIEEVINDVKKVMNHPLNQEEIQAEIKKIDFKLVQDSFKWKIADLTSYMLRINPKYRDESSYNLYKFYKIEYDIKDMYEALKYAGDVFIANFGHKIGQYFSNMYSILETIDKYTYDKEYYFKLFSAQLSRKEMMICLINSISSKSKIENITLLDKNDILNNIFYNDLTIIKTTEWRDKEQSFVKSMFNCYREELETKIANELKGERVIASFLKNKK